MPGGRIQEGLPKKQGRDSSDQHRADDDGGRVNSGEAIDKALGRGFLRLGFFDQVNQAG